VLDPAAAPLSENERAGEFEHSSVPAAYALNPPASADLFTPDADHLSVRSTIGHATAHQHVDGGDQPASRMSMLCRFPRNTSEGDSFP